MLEDRSFERFVAVQDMQEAYDSLDVGMLIDCALQLNEGQSVLLRSHRSGLTPDTLLELALKICVSKGQLEHLDRLANAAKSAGDHVVRVAAVHRVVTRAGVEQRPVQETVQEIAQE